MKIQFNKLPETFEEFENLTLGKLSSPEYTCAMFICALRLFVKDSNIGVKAINVLKGPQPLSNHEVSWYKDRLYDKKYLPNVYFEGATPDNNYKPSLPYTISLMEDPRPQDCQEGYLKLYIKTPAFDSPRYFVLRKKDNNWYIWEVYSIMQGVRIPVNEDPWA